MNKSIRQHIHDKYGGRCAYTGRPLGDDWQVDHILPKRIKQADPDNTDNLLHAIRIVNHYKRGFGLEGFRIYMKTFHLRLTNLPKNTKSTKVQRRKEYMLKIAELFDITVDKPFDGVFYFETLKPEQNVQDQRNRNGQRNCH